MKYAFLFLSLWALAAQGQSVSDTVFYDIKWKKCTHDDYSFYRLFKKQKDLFVIRDHYKNGIVQMEGTYTSMDPEIKNGNFTYYFPSGYKQVEREFYNNKMRGAARYYDDSTGRLLIYAEYKNNMRNGKLIRYMANGNTITNTYRDDILLGTTSYVKPGNESQSTTGYISTEQEELTEILKNKFLLYIPDSLKHISAMVTVSFEIDTDGTIYNIKPFAIGVSKLLTNLVVASMKEMPKWQTKTSGSNDKMHTSHNFTVIFPQISVIQGISMTFPNTNANRGDSVKFGPDIAYDFFGQLRPFLFSSDLSDSLKVFIKHHYEQSSMANDKNNNGAVILTFNINAKGEMGEITVLESASKKLSDFVIKMVKKYPNWKTPSINGTPMNTTFNMTIRFPGIFVNVNCKSKKE